MRILIYWFFFFFIWDTIQLSEIWECVIWIGIQINLEKKLMGIKGMEWNYVAYLLRPCWVCHVQIEIFNQIINFQMEIKKMMKLNMLTHSTAWSVSSLTDFSLSGISWKIEFLFNMYKVLRLRHFTCEFMSGLTPIKWHIEHAHGTGESTAECIAWKQFSGFTSIQPSIH